MEQKYDTFFDESSKQLNRSLLKIINTDYSEPEKQMFIKGFKELVAVNKEKQYQDLKKIQAEVEKFLSTSILPKLKRYEYISRPEIKVFIKETLERCVHYQFTNDLTLQTKNQQMCSICTVEFKEEDKLVFLTCEHSFHIECIQKWFETKINCPLCRNNLFRIGHFENVKLKKKELQRVKQRLQQAQNRAKNLESLVNSFLGKVQLKPKTNE